MACTKADRELRAFDVPFALRQPGADDVLEYPPRDFTEKGGPIMSIWERLEG